MIAATTAEILTDSRQSNPFPLTFCAVKYKPCNRVIRFFGKETVSDSSGMSAGTFVKPQSSRLYIV